MKQLPILNSTPSQSRAQQSAWPGLQVVFATRFLLIAATLGGLHLASQQRLVRERLNQIEAPSLANLQRFVPAAARTEAAQFGDSVGYHVLDADGKSLGMAITTSPQADAIVGYAGASNVLLLLDESQRVQASALIRSGDTEEHVAQVVADDRFWQQFNGLTLSELDAAEIDAVSGATLTSLAIAEGIQLRLNGKKLNLRFPDELTLDEVRALWPQVASIEDATNGLRPLKDAEGVPIGWAARTGELVDAEEGYQGPTELLLLFDATGVLTQVRIRKSYDNEPYVGYVRQEYSFWSKFKGRNFNELRSLDLEREGIEGVSGATMTSLAVARTIRETMNRMQEEKTATAPRRSWNWSTAEIATCCLAIASMFWSRSKWRSRKLPRLLWQLTCFAVIGGWAGNLVSLALVAGWTSAGAQWRLAPGLCTLLLVAFVWPMLTKQNVYCDHVCPHGALQQWLSRFQSARRSKRKHSETGDDVTERAVTDGRVNQWSAVLLKCLSITPWLALVGAVGWLLYRWPIRLSWLEPFDAYSWRIGFTISVFVWLVSIGLAMLRPMAYCRLLCPTGKAIGYVRRGAHRQFCWIDAAMFSVAVLAWCQLLL